MSKIRLALSLLNSMVMCRENHSDKSRAAIKAAFEEEEKLRDERNAAIKALGEEARLRGAAEADRDAWRATSLFGHIACADHYESHVGEFVACPYCRAEEAEAELAKRTQAHIDLCVEHEELKSQRADALARVDELEKLIEAVCQLYLRCGYLPPEKCLAALNTSTTGAAERIRQEEREACITILETLAERWRYLALQDAIGAIVGDIRARGEA